VPYRARRRPARGCDGWRPDADCVIHAVAVDDREGLWSNGGQTRRRPAGFVASRASPPLGAPDAPPLHRGAQVVGGGCLLRPKVGATGDGAVPPPSYSSVKGRGNSRGGGLGGTAL